MAQKRFGPPVWSGGEHCSDSKLLRTITLSPSGRTGAPKIEHIFWSRLDRLVDSARRWNPSFVVEASFPEHLANEDEPPGLVPRQPVRHDTSKFVIKSK